MANRIILNEQQNATTKNAIFERLQKIINKMETLLKKAEWNERQTARYKALDEERKTLGAVYNML